jgi:NTE family protein
MTHIGILSVLEKEGVPIDMITGTSTGVVVGAFYAQGKHTGHIKELTPDLG